MLNKCAVYGCSTCYHLKKSEDCSNPEEAIVTFRFPLKKEELLEKWTTFVNIKDCQLLKTSVLFEKIF